MYTKQILGGWDLTESDFNSRQEWLTHCNGAQRISRKRGGSYCCIE